jgi:hypothetical protein
MRYKSRRHAGIEGHARAFSGLPARSEDWLVEAFNAKFGLEPGDVITIEAASRVHPGAPMILQARVTLVQEEPLRVTVQPLGAPISAS